MRKYALTICGLALAGCTAGKTGPTTLAANAVGGAWTSRSPAEVTACINQIAGPDGAARYVVTANDPQQSVYLTTVSFLPGPDQSALDRIIITKCLPPA